MFRAELEPSVDQRHVGRASGQQADGQRELDTLAGGLEARSHGRKHPAILAVESRGFFFPGFTARLRLKGFPKNGRKEPNFSPKKKSNERMGGKTQNPGPPLPLPLF